MQRSVYQHKILDTIAASGADITVKNRYVYINGVQMFKMDDVEQNGIVFVPKVSSVTAGVLTYTVPSVPVNSTTYTIGFSVGNPGATGSQDNPLNNTVSVITAATGTLANTDLVTQFKNRINNDANLSQYVVASGSTTLILTAVAAYPILVNFSTVSPITVAQTTLGIGLAGSVAEMQALGVVVPSSASPAPLGTGIANNTIWITGTTGTFAGTYYDLYYCASALNVGEGNTIRLNQENVQCLWVNNGSGNAAAFESIFNAILGGYQRNGTLVNFHELEVKNIYPNIQ